jgi:hypothetical protein
MPVPYVIGDPYIDADFNYLLSLVSSTTSTVQLPSSLALVYDTPTNALCGFSYSRSLTTLNPSSEILNFTLGVPWLLSANLSYPPSSGYVTTAPTGPVAFSITSNGSQIGTMTFTGQTPTFSLIATRINLRGSDRIAVVAPASYLGMSGILSFTILGYRFVSSYG